MRATVTAVLAGLILVSAHSAQALTRHRGDHPFVDRNAFSGRVGFGLPVGDFNDPDFGNQKTGVDWSMELEHFFGYDFSFGLALQFGSYDDETFGNDLVTNVESFGGFFRYVFVQEGAVHPYLKFVLSSMKVQFESVELIDETDPTLGYTKYKDDSDRGAAITVAGGALAMISNYVGVDGQISYVHGFTEEELVPSVDAIVGFDVEYIAFNIGVAIFFP